MNPDGIFVEAETSKWELNHVTFIISFIAATWTVRQHIDNCCARKYQYFCVEEKWKSITAEQNVWTNVTQETSSLSPALAAQTDWRLSPTTGQDFCENPKAGFLNMVRVELPLGLKPAAAAFTPPGRPAEGAAGRCFTAPPALQSCSWSISPGRRAGRDPMGIRHAKKGCSGSVDLTCSRTRITVLALCSGENAPFS